MNILGQLGISADSAIVGMAGIIILMLIFQIVQSIRITKQKKRLSKFMEGSDGKSLEGIVKEKLDEFNNIKDSIDLLQGKVDNLDETMQTVYQKTAIVKYDAFKEMGGKLSFVLVLLTNENNGFIINSMHSSREGCFTYVKEIINGKSFITLSEEEEQALDKAINSNNFME